MCDAPDCSDFVKDTLMFPVPREEFTSKALRIRIRMGCQWYSDVVNCVSQLARAAERSCFVRHVIFTVRTGVFKKKRKVRGLACVR